MGGISRLDQFPGLRELVARHTVDGLSQGDTAAAVAEAFPTLEGTTRDTVRRWLKDAKVQAHIEALAKERVNLIARTIDRELAGRLGDDEKRQKMDTRTLIELRREILPPHAQRHILSRGVDEGAAATEAWLALTRNPDAARTLGLAALPEGEENDEEEVDGEVIE
jgi:hypothetical protein